MKRDMDVVRKVLLAMEAHPQGFAPHPLTIEGVSDEVLGFHAHLMIQAGLIQGATRTYMGSPSPMAIPREITWAGYDFLELSREPSRWEKALAAVKAAGGAMTIELLSGVLKQQAEAAINAAIGKVFG